MRLGLRDIKGHGTDLQPQCRTQFHRLIIFIGLNARIPGNQVRKAALVSRFNQYRVAGYAVITQLASTHAIALATGP